MGYFDTEICAKECNNQCPIGEFVQELINSGVPCPVLEAVVIKAVEAQDIESGPPVNDRHIYLDYVLREHPEIDCGEVNAQKLDDVGADLLAKAQNAGCVALFGVPSF